MNETTTKIRRKTPSFSSFSCTQSNIIYIICTSVYDDVVCMQASSKASDIIRINHDYPSY